MTIPLLIVSLADLDMFGDYSRVELSTAVVAGHSHVDMILDLAFVFLFRNDLVLHLKVNEVGKRGLLESNYLTLATVNDTDIAHEQTEILLSRKLLVIWHHWKPNLVNIRYSFLPLVRRYMEL